MLPENKVKLLGRYRVWTDGWLLLAARYVDERKAQKGETLDEYITVDVGFEQTFRYDGLEYMASAYLNNATGTEYQEQAGFEMPEYVWGFQVGVKF